MSIWSSATRVGIDPNMSAERARYVWLVNVMALLSGGSTLLAVPTALHSGASVLFPLVGAQLTLSLATLGLNHLRRHWHATMWMGSVILVMVSVQALWVFGVESRVHYFLVPSTIIPFLVFPPEQERSAWLLSGMSALACLLIEGFGRCSVPLAPALAEQRTFVVTNLVILVGIVGAAGWYSRRATLHAEALAASERARSERCC